MYNIRQAMLADIDELCSQLKEFSEDYSTDFPPYKDQETSSKILKNLIENHLFYVASTDDTCEMVGFIAGFVCDHIYNPDIKTLAEAFWWVNKEHRRSGVGIELLETFEHWGKKNVDLIYMTIEEDTPLDERIFLNRGFKKKETAFVMEVI